MSSPSSHRVLLGVLPHGTLDLSELHAGAPFRHGQLRYLQAVGPYTIVTFHPVRRDAGPLDDQVDRARLHYYGYVEGRATGHGWRTLDAALAACIAHFYQGPDHSADRLFLGLLGA